MASRWLGLGALALAAACGDDVPSTTSSTTEASTGSDTTGSSTAVTTSSDTSSSSTTEEGTTMGGSESTMTSDASTSTGAESGSSGSSSSSGSDSGSVAECDPMDIGSEVGQVAMGSTESAADGVLVPCMKFDSVDLEFSWTAPQAGAYQIDLLGSDYDTAIMVLDADCKGEQLACNDDFEGIQSAVLVNLTADQTIVIVVDGYGGASGDFVLAITTAEATDCCEASVFGGCGDQTCADAVCAIAPDCCTDEWSSGCANAVAPIVCQDCAPDNSCCFAQATAGCVDTECQDTVCAVDDTCCSDTWTQACADMAISMCLACTPGGDCCEQHPEPGCSIDSCEATVCAIDKFCCIDGWYDYCADYAVEYCGGICPPGGGDTDTDSGSGTDTGFSTTGFMPGTTGI